MPGPNVFNLDIEPIFKKLETMEFNPKDFVTYKDKYDAYEEKIKVEQDINQVFNIIKNMMNEDKLFPTTHILNRVAIKLRQLNQLELVKRIYDLLERYNMSDEYTYSNMIETAGDAKKFELAKEAYQMALRTNADNDWVHNSMLNVDRKCQKFDDAKNTFEIYLRDKLTNRNNPPSKETSIRFMTMILIAIEAKKKSYAKELYETAVAFGHANNIIHGTMLTYLLNAGELEEAKKIYDKHPPNYIKKTIKNDLEIDLHNISYGEAYFALKELFTKYNSLYIIFGKGLHSKNKLEEHQLKQAVDRVARELNLNIKIDGRNSGRATLSKKDKLLAPGPIMPFYDKPTSLTSNSDSKEEKDHNSTVNKPQGN